MKSGRDVEVWAFGYIWVYYGSASAKRGEKPLIFYLTTAVYWIIMVFVWQWIFISILESFLLFYFFLLSFSSVFLFFFFSFLFFCHTNFG